jgi:hypothetical protein
MTDEINLLRQTRARLTHSVLQPHVSNYTARLDGQNERFARI